jgi:hypothetical protein
LETYRELLVLFAVVNVTIFLVLGGLALRTRIADDHRLLLASPKFDKRFWSTVTENQLASITWISLPDFEELPQVRLYDPTKDEHAKVRLFGLSAVIERPTTTIVTVTIGHAWKTYGGANFVLRAGYAGNLQLSHCAQLFHALVVFLRRTVIVHGKPASEDFEEDAHYFGVEQTARIVAETAGLFISHLEVGRWKQAADLIGQVFDGQLRAEVRTPVSDLNRTTRH